MSPILQAQAWLCRKLSAAAGWSGDPEEPRPALWPEILRLAGFNRLLPWLAAQTDINPPVQEAEILRTEATFAGRSALVRAEGLRRLDQVLREHGVEAIFLKGAAVAPLLYPCLAQRGMRDADVWVRDPATAARVQALLRDIGLRPTREVPGGHHHLDPLRDLSEAFSVEIHTNLAAPALSEAALSALWAMRAADPGCLPRLESDGLFLHHALHALNDPLGGALLRDLWESARLAGSLNETEWERVRRWAQDHGQEDRIGDVVRLAGEAFGFHRTWPRTTGTFAGFCAADRLRHPLPSNRMGRLLRHLRARALEEWQAHPRGIPRILVLREALRLVVEAVCSLPARIGNKWAPTYTRIPAHSIRIDQETLLHNRETGEVHLLNALSTRMYEACGSRATAASLAGIAGPAEGKACLQELVRGMILRTGAAPRKAD